jgi:hypothetical protein
VDEGGYFTGPNAEGIMFRGGGFVNVQVVAAGMYFDDEITRFLHEERINININV